MHARHATWRSRARAHRAHADIAAAAATGLQTLADGNGYFDSAQERYAKIARNVGSFAISQYGVATFRYVPGERRYSCTPFNVYIFPHEGPANDVRFLCEPGSLAFLAQHGFDFNKWIYEGVTYTSRVQEAALRKHKLPDVAPARDGPPIVVRSGGQSFVTNLLCAPKAPAPRRAARSLTSARPPRALSGPAFTRHAAPARPSKSGRAPAPPRRWTLRRSTRTCGA